VHFDDSNHVSSMGAASNAFDIEAVALHALGHIVDLARSGVPGAVMLPTVSPNFTKQALTQDDIDGFDAIYPSPAKRIPMPTSFGITLPRRRHRSGSWTMRTSSDGNRARRTPRPHLRRAAMEHRWNQRRQGRPGRQHCLLAPSAGGSQVAHELPRLEMPTRITISTLL
jgi:hypothetical protein